MKICIIGGMGDFGLFYAKLFKKRKFDVFINSRNEIMGEEFCAEKGFTFCKENDFKKMDIIVFSTPNSITPKLIEDISKKASKGTLLIDFCSVKSSVVPTLEKLKGKGFELASFHPMHGPRISIVEIGSFTSCPHPESF